eukprot:15365417-Ditylum_brightwellii.AAC.1
MLIVVKNTEEDEQRGVNNELDMGCMHKKKAFVVRGGLKPYMLHLQEYADALQILQAVLQKIGLDSAYDTEPPKTTLTCDNLKRK